MAVVVVEVVADGVLQFAGAAMDAAAPVFFGETRKPAFDQVEPRRAAWGEPPSNEEHMVKVNDCMRRAFDNKTIEECLEPMRNFDGLDAAGVRRLLRVLKGSRETARE